VSAAISMVESGRGPFDTPVKRRGFWRARAAVAALALTIAATACAEREPVLKQIDLPHSYYYREMYLPQLTSGPSSVAFSPDGKALVYSMQGSLWRQEIKRQFCAGVLGFSTNGCPARFYSKLFWTAQTGPWWN